MGKRADTSTENISEEGNKWLTDNKYSTADPPNAPSVETRTIFTHSYNAIYSDEELEEVITQPQSSAIVYIIKG